MNLEDIKQKIFEKLEPSGWGKVLKPFIFSGDFDNVIKQLVANAKEGKRFTPTMKQLFRAFEECPVDKLKVIIVGQDPYPKLGVADGVAFSCSNTMELQPSIKFMLDEINKSVYKGHPGSLSPDLTRWSNQGVLMLNTALTTTVGKIGQHYKIWQPFMAYLFDYLTWNKEGLVYVYMGKEAQIWAESVNDNNSKFFVPHPASAVYQKFQAWDSKNVFNEVNKVLKEKSNYSITW